MLQQDNFGRVATAQAVCRRCNEEAVYQSTCSSPDCQCGGRQTWYAGATRCELKQSEIVLSDVGEYLMLNDDYSKPTTIIITMIHFHLFSLLNKG